MACRDTAHVFDFVDGVDVLRCRCGARGIPVTRKGKAMLHERPKPAPDDDDEPTPEPEPASHAAVTV